jgi:ribosome biogenesis protein Nip4
MRWVEHVAYMGEMIHVYNILVGKPEEKRQLRRPRHRWEDNIRMDLREIGWKSVDWMHLVQDRDQWKVVMYTVMNLWFP